MLYEAGGQGPAVRTKPSAVWGSRGVCWDLCGHFYPVHTCIWQTLLRNPSLSQSLELRGCVAQVLSVGSLHRGCRWSRVPRYWETGTGEQADTWSPTSPLALLSNHGGGRGRWSPLESAGLTPNERGSAVSEQVPSRVQDGRSCRICGDGFGKFACPGKIILATLKAATWMSSSY